MPYAPGVQDRSGEYYAQGAANFGAGIGRGLSGLADGISLYKKRQDEESRMGGFLESIGALNDPAVAEAFTNGNFGKKQGIFSKAIMDFQREREMEDEIRKEEQQKAMFAWRANFSDKYNALPDDEKQLVPALASDYIEGANVGLQPDKSFVSKVFGMTGKGQQAFFSLLGKGMELFAPKEKAVQAPQFMQAPDGGQVMVNPNTGGAQYIKPQAAEVAPSYGTMPAPRPGEVGVLRDGKGGMRVIQPNTTGMPVQGTGGALGGDALPEDSPDAVKARLNSLNSLLGE